jgi:hypothetical protein
MIDRISNKAIALVTLGMFAFVASGCAAPRTISSSSAPGTPIVSFPNTIDHLWNTVIESKPFVEQAGVSGRALTVDLYHANTATADLLTLDANGNVGIKGSLSSVSTRSQKVNILPYQGDPIALLDHVKIVSYRYRGEPLTHDRHIGFIAEDTPSELSGREHHSMNLNNSVAVTIAAERKLASRLSALQAEVRDLQATVASLKGKQTTR